MKVLATNKRKEGITFTFLPITLVDKKTNKGAINKAESDKKRVYDKIKKISIQIVLYKHAVCHQNFNI